VTNDEMRIKLDQVDIKILRILQANGRITNAKLAQEVGLSAPPMLERVKKLERSGVIKGYRTILDNKKLGCDFSAFVALNLDVKELGHVNEFEAAIAAMPEVLEVHHIAGDIDILLKVRVHDQTHFKEFILNRLAPTGGINRIISWVVLSARKESTEISLDHARVKNQGGPS